MFDIRTGPKKEPKQIRFVRNTDWVRFDDILSNNPNLTNSEVYSTIAIDQKVNVINIALQEAFLEACPITYISSAVRKPPWLTREVEEAQRGIRRKLTTARHKKTDASWLALRESNKQYNKILSNSQRNVWRNFSKDTESVKESGRMNNILKTCTDTSNKLEDIYKPNGELTKNAEETLEVMTQTHFRESVTDPPVPPLSPLPISPDLLDKIYSPERIGKALQSFDPVIFQKAWTHIKDITKNIKTKNHETQHIPTLWRDSLGIFLPKPGKTDYNQAKSFRTITLSPVMLKLILWHMQHELNIANDIDK